MRCSAMTMRVLDTVSPVDMRTSISRSSGLIGDLVGQLDELVGRLAHRRDDDHHVVALLLAGDDAPGDVLDLLGVRHRAAAVLLDDDPHALPYPSPDYLVPPHRWAS